MFAQYIESTEEHPIPEGVKEVSVYLSCKPTEKEAKAMGNVEMDVTRVGDRYYETGFEPKNK